MDDPKERDDESNKLVEAWHAYGAQFTVFVPQQQPAPTTWDPDMDEFGEKGRVSPHYLKHWKYLDQTKDFLRERYAKYKILQGPSLIFECLIRKFQRRIFNLKKGLLEPQPIGPGTAKSLCQTGGGRPA